MRVGEVWVRVKVRVVKAGEGECIAVLVSLLERERAVSSTCRGGVSVSIGARGGGYEGEDEVTRVGVRAWTSSPMAHHAARRAHEVGEPVWMYGGVATWWCGTVL